MLKLATVIDLLILSYTMNQLLLVFGIKWYSNGFLRLNFAPKTMQFQLFQVIVNGFGDILVV